MWLTFWRSVVGADLKKHVEAAADELDAFIYRHVECYLPKEGINGNGNGFAPILRRLAIAVRRDTLNEARRLACACYAPAPHVHVEALRSLLPQEER